MEAKIKNKSQEFGIKKNLLSTYIQLFILTSSFLILFTPTLIDLEKDWLENPNYSHGFLVPVIAAYMIWQKKGEICSLPVKSSNWGLLIITFGMIVHVVSNLGAELFTMRLAIIITLFGISLFLLGKGITQKIAIPFAYLIFMIPIPAIIWNRIAFPLQIFVSKMAEIIIQNIGISVLREGNILYLTNAALEVVDACSGLRSLISLLALSAAFAYLSSHSKVKKWVLFVSAIPIAIIVNVLRLSSTAGLASRFGEGVVQGFPHELLGMVTFLFGLILLFALNKIPFATKRAKSSSK